MNNFLEVISVSKKYAQHTALNDVSMSIKEGSIFGLLGPNGAGKTSLIRIINRITAPDSGEVLLNGESLNSYDIGKIGYLPEERGLYPKMKVGEQAIYLARLKGVSKAEATKRLKEWFDKFEIMPWWNKKVIELSKGMQQKIQFVCTIIHDPILLILDEPFSGFDPINVALLKNEILELSKQGKTIIFSTHNMNSVEEICQDIALINQSKVVLHGNVAEIKSRYQSNTIRIVLKTNLESIDLPNLQIIDSIQTNTNRLTLRIRKEPSTSMQEIVQILPKEIDIQSVEEEIPSMNDIFIKNVQI